MISYNFRLRPLLAPAISSYFTEVGLCTRDIVVFGGGLVEMKRLCVGYMLDPTQYALTAVSNGDTGISLITRGCDRVSPDPLKQATRVN